MRNLHGITDSPKENTLRKLFYAAFSYMVVGVLSGLFYRELTKSRDFPADEFTQLSLVHTHMLALGFTVFLILLVLEHQFRLSRSKLFNWFFWTYNAGLIITASMLAVHGTMTVVGSESGPATAGIAGLGHIFLTVGMILLFLNLHEVLKPHFKAKATEPMLESAAK